MPTACNYKTLTDVQVDFLFFEPFNIQSSNSVSQKVICRTERMCGGK